MSSILFSYDDLAQAKTINKIQKAFARHNVEPIVIEAAPGAKRTSGVSYRELVMTFSDSQQVTLRIKQSGDIFQVLLNGKALPIKAQDNHPKAVIEIINALDTKRAAFQKALERRKAKLPPSLKTAAPKLLETLTKRRGDLIVIRDGLREELAELTAA